MEPTSSPFLNADRLLLGPWQAFERDVARLMIHNGFGDVKVVGGTGDRGADVLGTKDGQLWVLQCKHTTTSGPPPTAVDEVVEAGRAYKADRILVAVSRPPGDSFLSEIRRYERQGLHVEVLPPAALLQLMEASPEFPPTMNTLRPYQRLAAEALKQCLIDTGRGLVVLATGLGKTVVMAEIVSELFREGLVEHGRAIVLAHTHEIVSQLHRSFWHQLPKWVQTQQLTGVEMPQTWSGLTFSTFQSIVPNADALPSFGLVLVDEAHHIGAESFQRAIELLRPKMLGGVTATPWRGDGFDIESLLGHPLMQIGIADGLSQGYLSEVDYRMYADNIDWAYVQECSTNRYTVSQLNRKLLIPTRDDEAAKEIRSTFDHEKTRCGIVFCPTLAHANAICGHLRRYNLRAESISGEMSARERELLLSRLRNGQLHFIASVDLFNEGVDVPDVDLIVFMRATHSRRIFVQQLGRGLRITADKKRVVVQDFVTDVRRIAEVLHLDSGVRSGPVESVGLGAHLVNFRNEAAGPFVRKWMLDQASLILREGDAQLEMPKFNYPPPEPPGNVQ